MNRELTLEALGPSQRFFRDDHYGPTEDKTVFSSNRNDQGEYGVFSVCRIGKDLKFRRVRTPDWLFASNVLSGAYKEVQRKDVFEINPEHYDSNVPARFTRRVIQAYLSLVGEHKFGCLMCPLPEVLARDIRDWGLANVPDSVLAEDGREEDIHVTLKYGFHDDQFMDVRHQLFEPCFCDLGPIPFRLGYMNLFKTEDYDVLKIEVVSPVLLKLNSLVSSSYEVTDTHPQYVPHVTVAYIQKGSGDKFEGCGVFRGCCGYLDRVVYSDGDDRKMEYML